MSSRQPYLNARLQGFGTTIFTEMTRLAIEHKADNLGQGFPDFDGPESIKEAAIEAMHAGHNQYCRMAGVPSLTQAIAAHQRRFYDLSYDPQSEVTVYSGATEAIFATLQAICDVGDEIVLFEPYYDSYRASIAMAGATARMVTLRPPSFSYEPADLEAAISPKTRAILLNSPHNPSGKVFSQAELEHIAKLCRERDLLVITDEVYEHLVYEGEHTPLAKLPGMRERTIQISSSGKTFSFTGWKVGWTCAPPAISAAIRCAHQFITFCTANPFQHAIAHALGLGDDFYSELVSGYKRRRDRLCAGLERAGFEVLVPAGTYFALTDIRPLGYDDDVEFCLMLPAAVGVAAIPPSVFYEGRHEDRHLVRWAFCKSDALLDSALKRLEQLRPATRHTSP